MVLKPRRIAAAAALVATLAMPVTHAAAADLARLRPAVVEAYDAGADHADGWRRRNRRDGVDVGDVLAGILVLGGIAAIAGAASRDRDEQPDRYPADARYPRDARYRTPGSDGAESRGLTRAVDMCVDEVERSRARVSSVDDAERDARGWRVSGELDDGAGFTCRIGNDGRIDDVSIGALGEAAYDAADGSQYSDETYARLRATHRDDERVGGLDDGPPVDGDSYGSDPQPAYPGGPLPGEEGYDEAIAAQGYSTVR